MEFSRTSKGKRTTLPHQPHDLTIELHLAVVGNTSEITVELSVIVCFQYVRRLDGADRVQCGPIVVVVLPQRGSLFFCFVMVNQICYLLPLLLQK